MKEIIEKCKHIAKCPFYERDRKFDKPEIPSSVNQLELSKEEIERILKYYIFNDDLRKKLKNWLKEMMWDIECVTIQ